MLISKKFLTFIMEKTVKLKTVNVSAKGQIAIPADVRKMLGIKKGVGCYSLQHVKKFSLQSLLILQNRLKTTLAI